MYSYLLVEKHFEESLIKPHCTAISFVRLLNLIEVRLQLTETGQ